jgi:predicted ATPase
MDRRALTPAGEGPRGAAMPSASMPRVVITGGPGAGKTTLLAEFAARGYPTVAESARAIIAERLARGASRRPDPLVFARDILRRDIAQYVRQQHTSTWVFFDRGVIEAIGMVHEAAPLPAPELHALLAAYPFSSPVFILPPWEAIYTTHAERDQSFADALGVHARLEQWYGACGYRLREVPRLPVPQRADHILRILAESAV